TPAACAGDFIKTFGPRAYRRPLTAEEQNLLQDQFAVSQKVGDSFDQSIRQIILLVLSSPQFLYRAETSETPVASVVRVDPYELASRMSYFLWASMPDDPLLDAAGSGRLQSVADIEVQARRMLDSPRAHEMTAAFHDMWLELARLDTSDAN